MSSRRAAPDLAALGRQSSFWFGVGLLGAILVRVILGAAGLRRTMAGAFLAAAAIVVASFVGRMRCTARIRAEADAQARRIRRDASLRLLRAAVADFEGDRWGRRELDALRLLALNLAPRQILGPRLAQRLQAAVTAVRWGVLDRLSDVRLTADEAGLARQTQARLQAAILSLSAELDGVQCETGAPLAFHPHAVAFACGQAADACAAIRDALSPALVADLREVIDDVAARRDGGGEAPALTAAQLPESGALRVAVRHSDLAPALANLAARVFLAAGAPVHVEVREAETGALLALSWRAARATELDAPSLAESLRPLSSYGARFVIEETPPEGRIQVELFLPLAPAAAARLAASRRADAS